MPSTLPCSIRLRAALCHLVGPVGLIWPLVLLIGFWIFVYWVLATGEPSVSSVHDLGKNLPLGFGLSLRIRLILFLAILISLIGPFTGFFLTLWIWRSQRRHHPFIDQSGSKAFRLQRFVARVLLLVLVLSLLISVSMSILGFNDSPDRSQANYIAGNTLGWFGQTSSLILLLTFPFNLFSANQACRGRSS